MPLAKVESEEQRRVEIQLAEDRFNQRKKAIEEMFEATKIKQEKTGNQLKDGFEGLLAGEKRLLQMHSDTHCSKDLIEMTSKAIIKETNEWMEKVILSRYPQLNDVRRMEEQIKTGERWNNTFNLRRD